MMLSCLGWGYMYFNPAANFSQDFSENQVLAPMGMLMTAEGSQRINDTYPAATGDIPPGMVATDALRMLREDSYPSSEARKQVVTCLSSLINSLPPASLPELDRYITDLFTTSPNVAVPSPERPVGAEELISRLAILARKNAWLADREKIWEADPAASAYPGLCAPDTPTVTREVAVNLAIPRWHSTGVYAPAGQALTVTVAPEATALGLKVRIGTTADDISALHEWRRAPLVTVEVPITKEKTVFSSPFGGLVYVVVPDNASGSASVTFEGGIMAPWFKLGRDTNEKFLQEVAETGAPWGEIEGDNFIITTETVGLKRINNPQGIAAFWDRVLDACQELSNLPQRRYPERYTHDVQLIAGWLHNGYPLMAHTNPEHFDGSIDLEELERYGTWGIFHEIGHNHQQSDWTPDGTGEVTVNLFTCYVLETVVGIDCRARQYPTNPTGAKREIRRFVADGKRFQDWKNRYFTAFEMYLRIKEAYGWEAYKEAFRRYREPGFVRPQNDHEKWQTFARVMSDVTKHNLAEALAVWSIPITQATLDYCAQYPDADPNITRDLVPEPYVPPKTEPVSGEYMGVALAGDQAGEISLYRTRADIPGGEKDRRWKTTHLLLRRVEPTNGPFTIGNLSNPADHWEGARDIEITRPYYFGVYELTQEQYYHIMGSWKPNCFGAPGVDRETRPVHNISHDECRGQLRDGINWPHTGHKVSLTSILGRLRELCAFRAEFDLPTEAQWEYAARALTTNVWNNGESPDPYNDGMDRDRVLDKLGRYCGNGGESRTPNDPLMKSGVQTPYGPAEVGSYEPNAWGIYDTHGNVFEHCLDYLMPTGDTDAYSGKDPVGPPDCGTNAEGKPKEIRRVQRSGSWWNAHFGRPQRAMSHARELGHYCGLGTGHGATGLRICVDAAVAREPQPVPGYEKLTPAQYQARADLLRGVAVYDSAGLPGPVYCTKPEIAFPLIEARNWDKSPAVMAGAAFAGKGRVVVVADDVIDPKLGSNKRFVDNMRRWLSDGGKRKIREQALAKLKPAQVEELKRFVLEGGGLLVWGRAWPWRQQQQAEHGSAVIAQWPGNQLLDAFGLAVGDFCVSRTSTDGFSARNMIQEGAAVAPPDLYIPQRIASIPKPILLPPKARNEKGILVQPGETIAFLGDSITRLGANPNGYINLVLKGLEVAGVPGVKAVPAGIDGNHAGDMHWRIGGILLNPDVKILTISCGVNDVWGYEWGRGFPLEEYADKVRSMYNKAAAAGIQVVALTPTLIQEDPTNEKNRLLDPYADFIRAEAKLRNLPLADCRAAEIAGLAKRPKNSGNFYTYDGVHPVFEGNKLIARTVLLALGVPETDLPAIEAAWEQMNQ